MSALAGPPRSPRLRWQTASANARQLSGAPPMRVRARPRTAAPRSPCIRSPPPRGQLVRPAPTAPPVARGDDAVSRLLVGTAFAEMACDNREPTV